MDRQRTTTPITHRSFAIAKRAFKRNQRAAPNVDQANKKAADPEGAAAFLI
jgi:hypothetical protein